MTRGDQVIERASDRLQQLANEFAGAGGVKAKLADELADDAQFLRKLKPSLIRARARGDAPTDQPPGSGTVAPTGPQLGARPKPSRDAGPNPFVVVAAALAAGIVLAKVIDWAGHAFPRD